MYKQKHKDWKKMANLQDDEKNNVSCIMHILSVAERFDLSTFPESGNLSRVLDIPLIQI